MYHTRLFTNLRILNSVSAAMYSYLISTFLSCLSQPKRIMYSICDHLQKFQMKKMQLGFHVPLGKNALSKMVKNMCSKASIEGNKTNHSLQTTGITNMFQTGISEKVIQDRSGHRFLDGLRKYERISEEQQAEACRVLAVPSGKENERLLIHLESEHVPAVPFPAATAMLLL